MTCSSERRNRKTTLSAVLLAVALVTSPMAASAQVAIEVDQGALQAALASCDTVDACLLAVEQFVAAIEAANPGVPTGTVVASVAAALVSAYNAGAVSATVTQVALSAVAEVAASRGLTELATTLQSAVQVVAAGDPIDLEAVAEGSASPA